MKKLLPILALLLTNFISTNSVAQGICQVGFHKNTFLDSLPAYPGRLYGHRFHVNDTAVLESFGIQGLGTGDTIVMAIYKYLPQAKLGNFVIGSDSAINTRGTVIIPARIKVTLLPGKYFVFAGSSKRGSGGLYDYARNNLSVSYYHSVAFNFNSGFYNVPGLIGADSTCCGEIKMWLNMYCCPRLDTIVVNACRSYTTPRGRKLTNSGMYMDTILPSPFLHCDSLLYIDLRLRETKVFGSNFTLTAEDTAATYQWLDCDLGFQPIAGANGRSFTDSTGGNFAVIVNKNGCIDTSDCQSISGLALQEPGYERIEIFPNPVQNTLSLKGLEFLEDIEVFSVSGQHFSPDFQQKKNEVLVFLSNLKPGLYLVKLKFKNGHRIFKILKE